MTFQAAPGTFDPMGWMGGRFIPKITDYNFLSVKRPALRPPIIPSPPDIPAVPA
jgi:hypothetical protein